MCGPGGDAETLHEHGRNQRLIVRALFLVEVRGRRAFDRLQRVHADLTACGDRHARRAVRRDRRQPAGVRAVVEQMPDDLIETVAESGHGERDRRSHRPRSRRDRHVRDHREALMRRRRTGVAVDLDVVQVAEVFGHREVQRERALRIARPARQRRRRSRARGCRRSFRSRRAIRPVRYARPTHSASRARDLSRSP